MHNCPFLIKKTLTFVAFFSNLYFAAGVFYSKIRYGNHFIQNWCCFFNSTGCSLVLYIRVVKTDC